MLIVGLDRQLPGQTRPHASPFTSCTFHQSLTCTDHSAYTIDGLCNLQEPERGGGLIVSLDAQLPGQLSGLPACLSPFMLCIAAEKILQSKSPLSHAAPAAGAGARGWPDREPGQAAPGAAERPRGHRGEVVLAAPLPGPGPGSCRAWCAFTLLCSSPCSVALHSGSEAIAET